MRIVVRADSSTTIGSGHIIRCLTLADLFRQEGAEVAFVCAQLPGALFDVIQARGYICIPLPDSTSLSNLADAKETLMSLKSIMPEAIDWLIVDHYGLDAEWENEVKSCCRKLMVIDDIANRHHSCDILLDQNYHDESRYRGKVPPTCKFLLGPEYALLRPEYASYRKIAKFRKRVLKRVFVYFGGADRFDLTGKTLQALMDESFKGIHVDIVVGSGYSFNESLNALAKKRGAVTVHKPRMHLADLMMEADIGVGGGGVTNWERMTLGLPSIVITLAENQEPISRQLHAKGVLRYIGKADAIATDQIRQALLDEIKESKYLMRVQKCMDVCDGLGARRVYSAMTKEDA